ncbi:MAG: collagen binding domain-containing protein, partial [Candidatus Aphodomorpha sp.]
EITIRKISSETGAALPGATFRLTGNEVYDVMTGPDGTASITLPYGRYFLQELVAPDGYVLDQTLHTVLIDGEGVQLDGERRQDLVITLQNDPVAYCFILHKQDAATGKPLAGVVFTLSGPNRSETLTTDASGNTAPIRITPGTYTISETKAPNGYKKPLSGWTLVVGTDGKMTISGSGASIVPGCSGAIVTIENTKTPTSPGVGATGETGNNGQLLAGAILMLCSFVGLLWLALHDKRRGHTRSL